MKMMPYILVVEDDVWLAEQYVRLLRRAGFRVNYVTDALAAIDSLDSEAPQVIMLDVLLAGPNAFTLLHEIRSHADLASIPVILCTNSVDSMQDFDLASYGVVDLLNKATVTPNDLILAIRRVTI